MTVIKSELQLPCPIDQVKSKVEKIIAGNTLNNGKKSGRNKYRLISASDKSYGGAISVIDRHDFTIDLILEENNAGTKIRYLIRGSSDGLVIGIVLTFSLFTLSMVFLSSIGKRNANSGILLMIAFILVSTTPLIYYLSRSTGRKERNAEKLLREMLLTD